MISSCALAKYEEKENKNNKVEMEKEKNNVFVIFFLWKKLFINI
jgi:hypothetical protein